jgi:TetR/AcrR family transcriptional repressor of nem operon
MGRVGHCRQHILDSGTKVLFAKGYNGTGVKDIVDAAGVPKGSFYNHFSSKESFVVEALEKLATINIIQVKQQLTSIQISPKQRLINFFDGNYRCLESCDFSGGCIFGNLCLEMADDFLSIRHVTDKYMDKVIQLISTNLEDAKKSGEVVSTIEPKDLAAFIFYAWEGAVMRMKASRSPMPYQIFINQLNNYFIK